MPWKQTNPMHQRAQFVNLHREGLYSMAELCQRFSISRKTGYKWLARYQQGGLAALREQSRAPAASPQQMAPNVQQALLDARRQHPTWGPRKLLPWLLSWLLSWLAKRRPDLEMPAASAAGELLGCHGLTKPRRCRSKPEHPGAFPLVAEATNALWSADFKGQFPTQDGQALLSPDGALLSPDGDRQLQPLPDRLRCPAFLMLSCCKPTFERRTLVLNRASV